MICAGAGPSTELSPLKLVALLVSANRVSTTVRRRTSLWRCLISRSSGVGLSPPPLSRGHSNHEGGAPPRSLCLPVPAAKTADRILASAGSGRNWWDESGEWQVLAR